jgi:hypothetical protein
MQQTSRGKFDRLPRTTAGFTTSAFDGCFCCRIRMNYSTLSPESETCSRSPAISSIAFHAQPSDLRFASLIDMCASRPLARSPDAHASDPVLVHWLAFLLHASFRPRLAATPLRFAITSPLSGCDLHLQAVEHARRTNENRPPEGSGGRQMMLGDALLLAYRGANHHSSAIHAYHD